MDAVLRSPSAIEITSLSKIYHERNKSTVKAVNDLNLSIPTGQIFGFLGSNGAGKTTTIKMICGLITPTTGNVVVNGYDVARERSMAMRQLWRRARGNTKYLLEAYSLAELDVFWTFERSVGKTPGGACREASTRA